MLGKLSSKIHESYSLENNVKSLKKQKFIEEQERKKDDIANLLKTTKKKDLEYKTTKFRLNEDLLNQIETSNSLYREQIVQITRVTTSVKGGKIMSFRVLAVVGDEKGKVGLGIGKALHVSTAILSAIKKGTQNLFDITLTKNNSIPYLIKMHYGATNIILKPAKNGFGISAGSSIRSILELAGIKNISAKQIGSNNLMNTAKATLLALQCLKKNNISSY